MNEVFDPTKISFVIDYTTPSTINGVKTVSRSLFRSKDAPHTYVTRTKRRKVMYDGKFIGKFLWDGLEIDGEICNPGASFENDPSIKETLQSIIVNECRIFFEKNKLKEESK